MGSRIPPESVKMFRSLRLFFFPGDSGMKKRAQSTAFCRRRRDREKTAGIAFEFAVSAGLTAEVFQSYNLS